MNGLNLIVSLMLVFFLVACGDGSPEDKIRVFPEFEPYINKFVQDGADRGVSIDFEESGLSILLGPITNAENAAGVCNGDGTIEIANNVWDRLSDNGKEFLIYHELGHCILDYRHRNEMLANNEWHSIMRGGSELTGMSQVVNYSGTRKDYYINELFDVSTAEPEWTGISRDYHQDMLTDTVLHIEAADSVDITKFIDGSRDFQIEFTLENPGLASAGLRWGGTDFGSSIFIIWNHLKEMEIFTGPNSVGFIYRAVEQPSLVDEVNRITIRKHDDLYYFFVNQDFIYWTDYVPLIGSELQTIGASSIRILNGYPHGVEDFVIGYLD